MTNLDFILSRRSIRRFTEEKVGESQIKLLLEAAMSAPTAMNMKPWHFIVIEDPLRLAELRNALGLGAVWCGVHPINRLESSIKAILNLPEAVIPLNVVYVGHPDEDKPARTQFDLTKISRNLFEVPWEIPGNQD